MFRIYGSKFHTVSAFYKHIKKWCALTTVANHENFIVLSQNTLIIVEQNKDNLPLTNFFHRTLFMSGILSIVCCREKCTNYLNRTTTPISLFEYENQNITCVGYTCILRSVYILSSSDLCPDWASYPGFWRCAMLSGSCPGGSEKVWHIC